jgi:hypothetical protein
MISQTEFASFHIDDKPRSWVSDSALNPCNTGGVRGRIGKYGKGVQEDRGLGDGKVDFSFIFGNHDLILKEKMDRGVVETWFEPWYV